MNLNDLSVQRFDSSKHLSQINVRVCKRLDSSRHRLLDL